MTLIEFAIDAKLRLFPSTLMLINSCSKSRMTRNFGAIVLRATITLMAMALSLLSASAATQLDIAGPLGSGVFGSSVTVLSNGNFVVTDPDYDITTPTAITDVGAVYLYNGMTGVLISTLSGSHANDHVGSGGITVLPNGNYVVSSPSWANNTTANASAMTFCSGVTGVSGEVSASNSLVGSNSGDQVGFYGVTILTNGNYVVVSPNWNGQRGAVTFGNAATGVSGTVTAANSLVGSNGGERVGTGVNGTNGMRSLPNGNYVVISSSWNSSRGAVTWGSGGNGVSGTVSSSNSLTGTVSLDAIGNGGVTVLTNSNYVVSSFRWDNGAILNVGAVTFGNGTTGTIGAVSPVNSLVGNLQNDQLSNIEGGVTPLTNGNYVVKGPRTVTFGNGTMGVTGITSAANSLVANPGDGFISSIVLALTNGNYVVTCPNWTNAGIPNAGAVTLCDGSMGTIATISPSNSLVGTGVNQLVGSGAIALPNGNYVVGTTFWNSSRGAVTWGNGITGVVGPVSISNSLIGTDTSDALGSGGMQALSNGNYVVSSSSWNGQRGAVTLCNGTTGLTGEVSATNSLVGTTSGDRVGKDNAVALPNGNYVARSTDWNNNRGAATFANGVTGVVGEITAANSLVGGNANDRVGVGVTPLTNGNFVVVSPNWTGSFGAVTWGDGTIGVIGTVSAANSLVGSSLSDGLNSVTVLANGNYVVRCPSCNNSLGAVTWGNGMSGVSGTISAANSLVGSTSNDTIGNNGVTAFANSNYVVRSSLWDNGIIVDAGAVTLGRGDTPVTGGITANNSVRGTTDAGGFTIVFSYNPQTGLLAVGRPSSNIVTLFVNGKFRMAFDFDGDRRSDISVFRPSSGYWYISNSSNNVFRAEAFGTTGDQIVPGDYDGDGKTDIAVWRSSNGYWYTLDSSNNSFRATQFGQAGDIPTAGDYDGDGKTDLVVYRPSNNYFYLLYSSDNSFHFQYWGQSGDVPVIGDYDGDDKEDFAIFRPSIGTFYILLSSNGAVTGRQFGQSGDEPVGGDFDGDDKTDIAVFRPSTGVWYLLQSSDDSFMGIPWGTSGDIPAAGDYDGDGKCDLAVFRPSIGTFYIFQSTNSSLRAEQFGTSGDIPISSGYVY